MHVWHLKTVTIPFDGDRPVSSKELSDFEWKQMMRYYQRQVKEHKWEMEEHKREVEEHKQETKKYKRQAEETRIEMGAALQRDAQLEGASKKRKQPIGLQSSNL